jgi:hypothetical protein
VLESGSRKPGNAKTAITQIAKPAVNFAPLLTDRRQSITAPEKPALG